MTNPPALNHVLDPGAPLSIAMIFNHLISVIFLSSTLISCCLSTSNKRKDSEAASEEEFDEDEQSLKKKTHFIVDFENIIEHNLVQNLSSLIKAHGCEIVHPANSDLIKRLLLKKSESLLHIIFADSCKTDSNLFMAGVKIAHRMEDRSYLISLLESGFFTFMSPSYVLIEYFLVNDDFEGILALKKIGYFLDYFKIYHTGKTLIHHAVEKASHEFLKDLKPCDLYKTFDNEGFTPLFYAKDPKIIKRIRKHCPNIREFPMRKNLKMNPWRHALLNGDKVVVDALISFQRRYKRFKSTFINYFDLPWSRSASKLNVSRETILKDTLKLVQSKKIDKNWYRPWNNFFIKFNDEIGMDAGGVKVDWMNNLLRAFFDPSPYGKAKDFTAPLFVEVDEDSHCFAPNVAYSPNIFKFAGSIVGISLGLSVPLKTKFIPAIYRAIYDEPMDLENDLRDQNPSIYNSLRFLLEPTTDLPDLNLAFPNNPDLKVTRRNVGAFVKAQSESVVIGRYSEHVQEFVNGFRSVLHQNVTEFLFKEEFFKILIGKVGDYSVDEFVANTIFEPKEISTDFRRLISEMTSSQKSLLLKFITGLNNLPFVGFPGLKYGNIKITLDNTESMVDDYGTTRYPTSSTCSNLLKVPCYESYEQLKELLIFAIEHSDTLDYEPGLNANDEIVLSGRFQPASLNIVRLQHYFFESESEISDIEEDLVLASKAQPFKRMFNTFGFQFNKKE